jgi:Skp family chaperone for outer membrane proteins
VEKNGMGEGVWKLWFTDGKLRAIGTYEQGKRIGYWKEWSPLGEMTVHEYAAVSGQSKPKKIPAAIRLGYFCSIVLFCRSSHVVEAQKRADSYIKTARKRLTEHKKRAKELRQQLNDDSRLISSEEKKNIELELRKEIALYDSLMHTTLGEKGALTRFNDRVSKSIFSRVDTIIQSIAGSNEYRFVIDERNTIVYPAEKKGSYYPDELIGQLDNITLQVLDRVNRQTLDLTIEKPDNRNEGEK